MLISLFLICYTLFTAYISGIIFIHLFSKFTGIKNEQDDFAFFSIAGLCWIAIVLSIQHLFLNIGIYSHLLIWFINVIVWSVNAKHFSSVALNAFQSFKTKPKQILFLYILFLVGALINIIARPAVGDAADYHFQAIRWIEEYKVVPGIGNVRRQLGNNSNWFLLNAFFGFSFTGLRSVYVLNASLLLMMVSFFAKPFENFLNGKTEKFLILKSIILVYLMLTVFRKYVGAVTNDYPVTLMILYIFTMLLEAKHEDILTKLLLIFFIAVMITFKLSALPMALLAVFIFFSLLKQIRVRQYFVFASLIIILFIPWIITNVMNCGYLVFPISSPDLFVVDWKMRKSVLEWEVMANLAWARVPFTDVEISKNYVFAQWFPLWLKSLDGFSIFLMAGAILSSGVMGILLFVKKSRALIIPHIKTENIFIAVTGAVALYLWFTHGPTPRFVFGYLVFLLAAQFWLMNHVFAGIQRSIIKNAKHLFLLIAAIFFVSCATFLPQYFSAGSFAGSLIVPKSYTEVKTGNVKLKNGFVNVPEKNCQCWDSPLPCTSALDTTLTWRGTKMEEGFKIK